VAQYRPKTYASQQWVRMAERTGAAALTALACAFLLSETLRADDTPLTPASPNQAASERFTFTGSYRFTRARSQPIASYREPEAADTAVTPAIKTGSLPETPHSTLSDLPPATAAMPVAPSPVQPTGPTTAPRVAAIPENDHSPPGEKPAEPTQTAAAGNEPPTEETTQSDPASPASVFAAPDMPPPTDTPATEEPVTAARAIITAVEPEHSQVREVEVPLPERLPLVGRTVRAVPPSHAEPAPRPRQTYNQRPRQPRTHRLAGSRPSGPPSTRHEIGPDPAGLPDWGRRAWKAEH
jgi:hypothetical protein